MLEQKTIRKKDVQTLLNLQESVYGSISGSLPYLINTFYEDMNREFENNKVLQKITKEDADGQTRAKEDV